VTTPVSYSTLVPNHVERPYNDKRTVSRTTGARGYVAGIRTPLPKRHLLLGVFRIVLVLPDPTSQWLSASVPPVGQTPVSGEGIRGRSTAATPRTESVARLLAPVRRTCSPKCVRSFAKPRQLGERNRATRTGRENWQPINPQARKSPWTEGGSGLQLGRSVRKEGWRKLQYRKGK